MNSNSNRLFSEFLSAEDLKRVNYYTYFACLQKDDTISLLPSDHCLYYPLEIKSSNKEIVNGDLNFFNKVFYNKYTSGNDVSDSKYKFPEKTPSKEQALIINLLDNCYGHSFLKLLNLYTIYHKYSPSLDLWVIAPSGISHFVPEDKFYKVDMKMGFNDAMNCYSLGPIISAINEKYQEIDFVTLDTYSLYSDKEEVIKFFPFIEEGKNLKKKYVTFYYRSDYFRTWGGAKQSKLINEFFCKLRNYFTNEVEFLVVGDKDDFMFSGEVIDKRTNEFGKAVDQLYNEIFAKSYMVIGLIGSNMLQPSMFCDFTIHLTPRSKATIVAEEFFNSNAPAIQGAFNNIYLYGNENLSDISPTQMIEKTILLYFTYLAKVYKKAVFTSDIFSKRISQKQFISEHYGYFKWDNANSLKCEVTNVSFRYNLKRYRLYKIFKLLKVY